MYVYIYIGAYECKESSIKGVSEKSIASDLARQVYIYIYCFLYAHTRIYLFLPYIYIYVHYI